VLKRETGRRESQQLRGVGSAGRQCVRRPPDFVTAAGLKHWQPVASTGSQWKAPEARGKEELCEGH